MIGATQSGTPCCLQEAESWDEPSEGKCLYLLADFGGGSRRWRGCGLLITEGKMYGDHEEDSREADASSECSASLSPEEEIVRHKAR